METFVNPMTLTLNAVTSDTDGNALTYSVDYRIIEILDGSESDLVVMPGSLNKSEYVVPVSSMGLSKGKHTISAVAFSHDNPNVISDAAISVVVEIVARPKAPIFTVT